ESIDLFKGLLQDQKASNTPRPSPWWQWDDSRKAIEHRDLTRTGIKRRRIRVFISSTFIDMQKERDILIRFIFPELKSLFKDRRIDVVEIDYRWGITEDEAETG